MEKTLTIREKIAGILSSSKTQWAIIILLVLATIIQDDIAYYLGIIYVLLLLWSRKWGWNFIGLVRPESWKNLFLQSIIFSILLLIVVDLMITPMIEIVFKEQVDLSGFDGLRGDFLNYIILILFMWVIAAFGEEFVYRGLLIERLGNLLGNTKLVLWLAVGISSILFGLAHSYQGISGMLSTGIVSLILGALFITNKNKLWLTILTHGIYDVIGITLIYLNIETQVYGLLKNMFFN